LQEDKTTKRQNGLGWIGDKPLRRQIRLGVLPHVVILQFVMHPPAHARCRLTSAKRLGILPRKFKE